MAASSSFSAGGNASDSSFSLSHQLSIKLDERNFSSWKQQVEGILRGRKLLKFASNPTIPERFLNEADILADCVNPLYSEWEQQDALLFSWLLSTLSDSVLPHVVTCTQSWQLWEELHCYFREQSKAQLNLLRSELRYIKKGNLSMVAFLNRVKA